MKITFIVLWLLANGDIESVQEGPTFTTMEECLFFKYRNDEKVRAVGREAATGGFLSYCAPEGGLH